MQKYNGNSRKRVNGFDYNCQIDKFTLIGWQTASIQPNFLPVEGKQRQNLAYEENETGTIGIPDAARYEFQIAGGIY